MIPVPFTLSQRWASGNHVGDARPEQNVGVCRGYLQRFRRSDGWWTARWEPLTDWQTLPGISRVDLEQSFESNGITTATVDLSNIAYPLIHGVTGDYHKIEEGWFSPFRGYTAGGRSPGLGVAPNEWEGILATAAMVQITQGYGDRRVPTFVGLLDSVNVTADPLHLTLVARDMGQLLTDCHLFGWNIDPDFRDPVHFTDEKLVNKLEQSTDEQDLIEAARQRNKWVVIDDLSQAVSTALTWGGLPKHSVQAVGTSIDEAVAFSAGEYLIDIIRKAQDVCGYTFFIGEPRPGFALGEPIFRRSNVVTVPPPALSLRDDQLLTGLSWQRTDEPLAGIIRVRGKEQTKKRGGRTLGGESGAGARTVLGVYRPPWHRRERDARLIRHVVHAEPLYKTEAQCLVACKMIALQEALAATTATITIPAHPGIQLDDILSIYDRGTGLASRVWVASKQSTFEAGRDTSYTMSLGVALLDTPDVVEVINELGSALRAAPTTGVTPANYAAG